MTHEFQRSGAKGVSRRTVLTAAGAACIQTFALPARAQMGDKPITFVVPWAPGGTSDVLARQLGSALSQELKQTVIVENRAGAGTVIGTNAVAKSAPDGHTILLSTASTTSNASLRKSLPYDTLNDLTPVITVAAQPMVIMVNANSPITDLRGLIERGKQAPPLNYGSAGEGSVGQLTTELLKSMTGMQLTHIPFAGSAPSVNALLGGHVDLAADTVFLGRPHIVAGKLRALAVSTSARSAVLPNVPTVAESGIKDFSTDAWWGIAVRAGTPQPVVERLNAAFRKVLALPAIKDPLERDGFQLFGDTPEQAAARYKADIAKMAIAVRVSGAKAE